MRDNHAVNYSLICAVCKGELEKVTELIQSFGLSYSKGWSEGYVLLRDALLNRNIEIAKLLLNYGCKVNSENTMPSDTPLHLAAASSDTELVEMILDKGARINAVNMLEEIPLHLAASEGCPETVDYLLKHGADVNAIDNVGASPLHLAAFRGCSETIHCLLEYGAYVNCVYTSGLFEGYTPLHCAVEKGSTEAVQLLLDSGVNVDAIEKDGNTSLHIAVFKGKETIVELLLRYGAKVDNLDKNGKTALHLAVENGSLPTIKYILKYSPDVNNQSNRKSLKIAVIRYTINFKEVVEALLKYGFSISPGDVNNKKLLHAAVEKGYVKIVEDFLKYGANVNTLFGRSRHGKGLTLLHIAVINKQGAVADLLISNKADINANSFNIVKLLLKHGTRVNSRDKDGKQHFIMLVIINMLVFLIFTGTL
ncbi:serine/threonine-protein phosphatase 6 regulatory ankyrin repeat subunit B-like [Artemia franciscana]|uniref:serine/threonine-protein phosphatase 6 regulatory ankyrin repeat subunit B-like n=1 Tax=Artemia franciscana TaxID=6661 RepID=UPI0032DA372D